ncbi:SRPBCC domain-containing protein [Caulobacter sp. Root655]|uniref:SRPBCC domain-containing protein n=1 Tax=Caulobacter sp. Root655 TaxID=1736578 RepID=UPI0009E90B81|nr:SRPBCC domain-containing protein [Caulobacter sp. Root655]
MTDQALDRRLLTITRLFSAPRALVFDAFIDPAQVLRWLGPPHYPATFAEGDPRPGGAWRACLTGNEHGDEAWQSGVYREINPPERLIYTFFGFLDVTPRGRNETGPHHSLGDWVRPHDMYGQGGSVEANGRYHPPACGCGAHP